MNAIKPYDAGRYAWGYGDTLADNPHPAGSAMYDEWARGYRDAIIELDNRLSTDLGAEPDPLRGRMSYLMRTLDGLQHEHARRASPQAATTYHPMPALAQ